MVGVCGLVLYFVLCLFLADAQLSLSLTYQNLVHVFFTSALPLSPHATNERARKRELVSQRGCPGARMNKRQKEPAVDRPSFCG